MTSEAVMPSSKLMRLVAEEASLFYNAKLASWGLVGRCKVVLEERTASSFPPGTRVRVVEHPLYASKYKGKFGIVASTSADGVNEVLVMIDGVRCCQPIHVEALEWKNEPTLGLPDGCVRLQKASKGRKKVVSDFFGDENQTVDVRISIAATRESVDLAQLGEACKGNTLQEISAFDVGKFIFAKVYDPNDGFADEVSEDLGVFETCHVKREGAQFEPHLRIKFAHALRNGLNTLMDNIIHRSSELCLSYSWKVSID